MDISPHTIQKHRAMGFYLKIIRNLVKSPRLPFKELYYADLFCGDGECDVKAIDRTYEMPVISSLLGMASKEGISLHCFLNDFDPTKIDKMKQNTKEYSQFIEEYHVGDANVHYQDVLQKIPPDQLSIFFLDPTNHADLKWTTIEGISKHSHPYGDEQVRRPELVINLMTYTLINSYRAGSYQTINDNLGTEAWLAEIQKNKEEGIDPPVEKAFLNTFTKQLRNLGYSVPSPLAIVNLQTRNTVYYLVWATNPSGCRKIENDLIPYMRKIIEEAQKDTKIDLKKAEARREGIASLDKWFNDARTC